MYIRTQELFTERHWDKLPPTWRDALGDINPGKASWLLLSCPNHQGNTHRYVSLELCIDPLALPSNTNAKVRISRL